MATISDIAETLANSGWEQRDGKKGFALYEAPKKPDGNQTFFAVPKLTI